jgi:hypothetical protein
MIDNIISIDLEFNRQNQPLSIGLSTTREVKEFYINNKSDKYTFKIHGLKSSFLNKNGKNFKEIEQDIKNKLDKKIILGFDIRKDLYILNLKQINKRYLENTIIDIKDLFTFLGINSSLSNIYKTLLKIENKENVLFKKYTIHTAVFDSIINIEILKLLIEIANKNNIKEDIFIKDLLELTKYSHLYQKWELEIFENVFLWLKKYFIKKEFKIILNKIKKEIQTPDYYSTTDKYYYIFDKYDNLLFKYPLDFKTKLNINFKKRKIIDLDMGIKFIN